MHCAAKLWKAKLWSHQQKDSKRWLTYNHTSKPTPESVRERNQTVASYYNQVSKSRIFRFKSFRLQCSKVEKILKGSLDSIPSPSRSCEYLKFLFLVFGANNKFFVQKRFVDNTQQCFALTPQANFPAHNLDFHWRWRWWNRIQAIF